MNPNPQSRKILGIALLASSLVLLTLGVLFLTGFLPMAEDARLVTGGAVVAAAAIDALVGVKFLTSA